MKPLSDLLTDDLIENLRQKAVRGDFSEVDFKTAMTFLLSDGVVPESGLPVDSFLRLEDWVRDFSRRRLSFTRPNSRTRRASSCNM